MPQEPAFPAPHAACQNWLEAVYEKGDMVEAWRLTDPETRREIATTWIESNPDVYADRDQAELLQELVAETQTVTWKNRSWQSMSRMLMRTLYEDWPDFTLERYGCLSDQRPVALDTEIVFWVPMESRSVAVAETGYQPAVVGRRIVMRLSGGEWRFLRFDDSGAVVE